MVHHAPHTKAGDADPATDGRIVTTPPHNAAGKVTIVHGTTFLNFSDAIYILIH